MKSLINTLSFHFVLPINAFLFVECKRCLGTYANKPDAETFHCVSFVKQIGKPLSFVLFLHHHHAGLNETKRKMTTNTIRNGEESETSDRNGGTT